MIISNLRNNIAKWLAPGVFDGIEALRDRADQSVRGQNKLIVQAIKLEGQVDRAELALQDIASLRTPKCAHIGNRMADIADAALAHREGDSA